MYTHKNINESQKIILSERTFNQKSTYCYEFIHKKFLDQAKLICGEKKSEKWLP